MKRGYAVTLEGLDQLEEIEALSEKPVNLVNQHHVDLSASTSASSRLRQALQRAPETPPSS